MVEKAGGWKKGYKEQKREGIIRAGKWESVLGRYLERA